MSTKRYHELIRQLHRRSCVLKMVLSGSLEHVRYTAVSSMSVFKWIWAYLLKHQQYSFLVKLHQWTLHLLGAGHILTFSIRQLKTHFKKNHFFKHFKVSVLIPGPTLKKFVWMKSHNRNKSASFSFSNSININLKRYFMQNQEKLFKGIKMKLDVKIQVFQVLNYTHTHKSKDVLIASTLE